MANRVPVARMTQAINQAVSDLGQISAEKTDRALRATVIDRWGAVITKTPVDTGRARGNWFVTVATPSRDSTSRRSKTKGGNYVNSQIARLSKDKTMFGQRWFLTNNVPYIETLEFGGYPNPVKTGTRNPRSGKIEKRSRGGFSRQAPKGMVRTSLVRFGSTFRRNYAAEASL